MKFGQIHVRGNPGQTRLLGKVTVDEADRTSDAAEVAAVNEGLEICAHAS